MTFLFAVLLKMGRIPNSSFSFRLQENAALEPLELISSEAKAKQVFRYNIQTQADGRKAHRR